MNSKERAESRLLVRRIFALRPRVWDWRTLRSLKATPWTWGR
jgi:hypothetical protein